MGVALSVVVVMVLAVVLLMVVVLVAVDSAGVVGIEDAEDSVNMEGSRLKGAPLPFTSSTGLGNPPVILRTLSPTRRRRYGAGPLATAGLAGLAAPLAAAQPPPPRPPLGPSHT